MEMEDEEEEYWRWMMHIRMVDEIKEKELN